MYYYSYFNYVLAHLPSNQLGIVVIESDDITASKRKHYIHILIKDLKRMCFCSAQNHALYNNNYVVDINRVKLNISCFNNAKRLQEKILLVFIFKKK